MSCHSSLLLYTHFSVTGPEFHELQAHIPSSDILCLLLCCWKVPRALHSNSLTASISSLHPPPPQRRASSSMFPHISLLVPLSHILSLYSLMSVHWVSLLDTYSSVIQPNYTKNSSVYLCGCHFTHSQLLVLREFQCSSLGESLSELQINVIMRQCQILIWFHLRWWILYYWMCPCLLISHPLWPL